MPCLKDVNGKVTLLSLGVLCDILPCVGPHMANVASLTVSTVAANLASSNREIHDAASQALDHLVHLVGTFSVLHRTIMRIFEYSNCQIFMNIYGD